MFRIGLSQYEHFSVLKKVWFGVRSIFILAKVICRFLNTQKQEIQESCPMQSPIEAQTLHPAHSPSAWDLSWGSPWGLRRKENILQLLDGLPHSTLLGQLLANFCNDGCTAPSLPSFNTWLFLCISRPQRREHNMSLQSCNCAQKMQRIPKIVYTP